MRVIKQKGVALPDEQPSAWMMIKMLRDKEVSESMQARM